MKLVETEQDRAWKWAPSDTSVDWVPQEVDWLHVPLPVDAMLQ